jgi:hypothetical protein
MAPAQRARIFWNEYKRAYRVYQATQNPDIKFACKMIACHMQGKKWCEEHGHTYRDLDELDFQIVEDEEAKLKEEGKLT